MFQKTALVAVLCLVSSSAFAESKWWEKTMKEYENSVVQVEPITHIGLNFDANDDLGPYGSGGGTGFVVDADQGLIVTNYHVLTSSPNIKTTIRFKNGEEAETKVIYVDPWVDFGFLKYDPKSLKVKPKAIPLGSQSDLHAQDEVLLVGNSSGVGISYKLGYINYLFKPRMGGNDLRVAHAIHATLSRAGGASGSPVWVKNGKVIGLHQGGKDFEAFFIRIDYIKDALAQLQQGKKPQRGDLFFDLFALSNTDAKKFFSYPENLEKEGIHENNGPHQILKIDFIMPTSKAAEVLKSGDLVVGLQGKNNSKEIKIGNSLYTFEKIVNENVGGTVNLTIFRPDQKKTMTFTLPVSDANESIPQKYSQIGSAIFQNVTPAIALYFGVPPEGVYTPFIGDPDSSTWNYGRKCKFRDEADSRARCFIIRSINGAPIRNIEDFNTQMKKHLKDKSALISVLDLSDFTKTFTTRYVDFQLEEDMSLKMKTLNPKTLDWETEEIKP